MPINILMPALSPTMTEGNLASWQKVIGDKISAGDVIAEIETDKATMEVEAVDEGTLGKILVDAGTEGVMVNTVIAVLLEEGETDADIGGAPAAAAPTSTAAVPADAPAPAAVPIPAVAPPAPVAASGDRIFASPLARRIAAQKGLDLATLKGSGPNGRIVKADVEAAQAAPPAPAPTAPAPAPTAPAPAPVAAPAPAAKTTTGDDEARRIADAVGVPYTDIKNSTMRKTVARRLSESKQTVPHFYLTVDCEIDALLGLRKQLNERHEVKVSVNDYVIKAAALSCKKVPAANASWTPDAILQYDRVDMSVAVAIPDGLITPVIVDAGNKGLQTISSEMKDLAGRAREGKLKPAEFAGGTFSISNLGMFGIKDFGAIINPPQGCILAVGAGEQRAVVKGGELAVATVMSVTLSVDHRVVDGAVGAQWLKAFKGYIEDPVSMLL